MVSIRPSVATQPTVRVALTAYRCNVSMRAGAGRPGRASRDAEAQKAMNAEAPTIPNLLARIAELFEPHKAALTTTIVLVLIGAGLSVFPPLLTRAAFDEGLFPPSGEPNVPFLLQIV